MAPDYIERLREAILATHGCHSIHSSTARVRAEGEEPAFDGQVEVFDIDHPKAKKCYAWGNGDGAEFQATCMLELPPVESPSTAVKAATAPGAY